MMGLASFICAFLLLGMLSSQALASSPETLPLKPNASKECVILLHGLARSKRSMLPVQKALETEEYQVINLGYPSRRDTVENLAIPALESALAACVHNEKIHIVTHSMGGILVRYYLQHNTIEKLGRVVMMGPPNQGSEIVDKLGNWPGYKLFNGPAGKQLGTAATDIPQSLEDVSFDLGIIAGTKSVSPIFSMLIPGPDDGKVSVAHTKISGMTAHIELPVSHTFMMRNTSVLENIKLYLRDGKFITAETKK